MQDNEIKQIEQHLRSDLYKMKEQIDSLKKDKESLTFKVEQMRDKETKSEYEKGVMKVEMESKVTNMEMTHDQLQRTLADERQTWATERESLTKDLADTNFKCDKM